MLASRLHPLFQQKLNEVRDFFFQVWRQTADVVLEAIHNQVYNTQKRILRGST